MINNTIERLRIMKMNALAAELERQLEDAESYSQIGFEDRLTLLVDAEWNRRQNNKLDRYMIKSEPIGRLSAVMCIIITADTFKQPDRHSLQSCCRYIRLISRYYFLSIFSPPFHFLRTIGTMAIYSRLLALYHGQWQGQ